MQRSALRPLQRGAALLLAMLILTLVATLAAGMVWQQSRSVQLEASQRARAQAEWMLDAGLDFSRLILREDARANAVDDLSEPWAQELGEARLSSLLAADQNNNADTEGLDAFLSGRIIDAQSRYNLLNLIDAENKPVPLELQTLQQLCDSLGLPGSTATLLADGLRQAHAGVGTGDAGGALLVPTRIEDLRWLGLDATALAKLRPYITLLPERTPVNANTASREVLAAVAGIDLGTAEHLVQVRQRRPFNNLQALARELPTSAPPDETRLSFRSRYFEVYGRLRLDDRALEERTLVVRRNGNRGPDVVPLQRDRHALQADITAATTP